VPEDRHACEGFSCGERGYERQLDAFITHDVWRSPRTDVRVVVAVDEDSARIVGFAAWHPAVSVEPDLESEEREYKTTTSIQISRFAARPERSWNHGCRWLPRVGSVLRECRGRHPG
jgi:hypothetical protein